MNQVGLDGGQSQLGSLPVSLNVGLGSAFFFGSARLGRALLGGRLCLLLLGRACSGFRLRLLGGGLSFFLVFGGAALPLVVALVTGGVDGALRLRHGALCGGGSCREGSSSPRAPEAFALSEGFVADDGWIQGRKAGRPSERGGELRLHESSRATFLGEYFSCKFACFVERLHTDTHRVRRMRDGDGGARPLVVVCKFSTFRPPAGRAQPG